MTEDQTYKDGYDTGVMHGRAAGFAAALSEHEQMAWWDPINETVHPMVDGKLGPLVRGFRWEPLYRRLVEEPTTQAEPRVVG